MRNHPGQGEHGQARRVAGGDGLAWKSTGGSIGVGVVSCYDLPAGNDFGSKLEWLARTLTLTWLAEAADHDPGDIPKHLS